MDSPIYASSPVVRLPDVSPNMPGPNNDLAEVMRQILDVQRDQLHLMKMQLAMNDSLARWRGLLGRWQGEFPTVGVDCKRSLPLLERAYLTMLREVTDVLDAEPETLDNEFTLAEFLDKYGVRLNQLGMILGQVGPIADAAPVPPPASAE